MASGEHVTHLTADEREDLLDKLAELDSIDAPVSVTLSDGLVIRGTMHYDESHSLEDDGDWYGEVAPVSHRTDDYGRPMDRPRGFDGNAEKLSYDRGAQVWWQPPRDVPRGSDGFDKLRDSVLLALEFGFYGFALELCEGTDAYGRPIVREVASLWGIAPVEYPDSVTYYREVWSELLAELVGTDAGAE